MDCEAFENSEIDALYDELDAAASAAMTEHASTCPSCEARFERLKRTRQRVLSVAVEAVPTDFESRIMAAVDAGVGERRAPAAAALAAPAAAPSLEARPAQLASGGAPAPVAVAGPGRGARILRFLARPSFAVAATFVLVLGAAALLVTTGAMSKRAAPMATASDQEPAASALESDRRSATAGAAFASSVVAQATAAPPAVVAAAEAPGGAEAATLALNDPPAARPSRRFAPPAAKSVVGASRADEQALASAKALAAAGHCGEALPKLEAMKTRVPEAELYAARCIAQTRGCAAAAPRFDAAAASNAGTETGSRAAIEGAKCYQASGQPAKARERLVAAKDEGLLEAEVSKELDALDRAGGPGAGAAPHGAGHAAPKAARPAPAAPPHEPAAKPPATPALN